MGYPVNAEIRESLYLGTSGETLTRAYSEIAGTPATFTPTLTDRGDGTYLVSYTPTVVGPHVWIGESSSGIPVSFDWLVEAATADAPAVDSDALASAVYSRLGRAVVSVAAPVAADKTVTLVQGDDYRAADGRALRWSGSWPDLTGAVITMTVAGEDGETVYDAALYAADTVQVELTAADTTALTPFESRRYTLVATLPSTSVVTLVTGPLFVKEGA